MSKHTPGPWVWDESRMSLLGPNRHVVLQDGEGLWDLCSNIASVHGKPKEAAANAWLIAASPELLACLEKSVASLEWAATVIGDMPPKCEYLEGLREAKEAIARAKGRA